MPNTKTGTTWAPDIRPEKIETFEETYTPEGGEQQIIEYRAVNHHPILNKVLDKMAFFRTHVGAIWYNLAERKTLLAKLNELDAEIREVNAKLDPVVLWENPDPTKAFVAQTITLSSAEYDYFDIMFKGSSGDSIMITHRGYKGYNMQIDRVGTTGRPTRTISYISDTQYAISKCTIYDFTNGTSADNNSNNIPVKIIGYKS